MEIQQSQVEIKELAGLDRVHSKGNRLVMDKWVLLPGTGSSGDWGWKVVLS